MVSFILVFYFYLKYRKFTKLKKNVINYDVIVEITSCVPQTSSLLLSHEYLSMFHAFDVLLEVPQKQNNFMFFFPVFHTAIANMLVLFWMLTLLHFAQRIWTFVVVFSKSRTCLLISLSPFFFSEW